MISRRRFLQTLAAAAATGGLAFLFAAAFLDGLLRALALRLDDDLFFVVFFFFSTAAVAVAAFLGFAFDGRFRLLGSVTNGGAGLVHVGSIEGDLLRTSALVSTVELGRR